MNQTIPQRVSALRRWMAERQLAAFIIPSTDPHLSEYVAPHWQAREWISGFTGSAGTVVVTASSAGLWTDSRYFLQAAAQLHGTGIALFKEMLPETPDIPAYLRGTLAAGSTVGIDGKLFSAARTLLLKEALEKDGLLRLADAGDPMADLWGDRPPMPAAPAIIYSLDYAGRSCPDKLNDIRQALAANDAESILLSALDEIAWTLNLRGADVHCNPVVICYLLVTKDEAHCFIRPEKVTPEVKEYLAGCGVALHPYEEAENFLSRIASPTLSLDAGKTNYALWVAVNPGCRKVEAPSPVALLKAVRNEREIAGLRNAMLKDGVALARFLMWLEKVVPDGGVTETGVGRKLHELRAAQPLYKGDSFDTIAGYGAHGAIVHYEATPETDAELQPRGFLLLDSGAQYLDGTTDITRTIPLGPLTDEEIIDYTLILKGHIALARAVYPEGTRGAQLDVLARMPIWTRRMNFLHGTGHGVGHFLNVHEGPQSIRMNENPVALRPGMVTTNEPGVYKDGSHGVRTENMMLTVPAGEGMFGRYLRFETLTLCPINTSCIDRTLLDADEVKWLDEYHANVCKRLSPLLNEEEKAWLRNACRPIGGR